MIKLVLSEVVQALAPDYRGEPPGGSVSGVSTDSRSIEAGDLFFAIRGPRFDGHDFVEAALLGGAAAAVVESRRAAQLLERLSRVPPPRRVLLPVDDPLAALGRLAAYHRRLISADVIAVVGSNGKTTTKEMIQHVLSGRCQVRASPRSFNNAVGVPLTLLSATAADDYLVVEIGTNARGEIDALCGLVRPEMAVLTCIGEEHLEGLSDLEGVAAEECAALRHLAESGFAAVNVDDPHVEPHLERLRARVVRFGRAESADLRVTHVGYEAPWLSFQVNGRFDYRLHMPGAHNATNACGAIAVGRRLGMEHDAIAERLASFVPPPMRSEVLRLGDVTIVNDAYNANPHSALAALATLYEVARGGRRIAVLGEMRELGERAAEQHRRVAQRIRGERIDHVVLVGRAVELMHDALRGGDLFCPTVECCADVDACGQRLAELVRGGDVVLLKASRAVGLERVIDVLRRRLSHAPAA